MERHLARGRELVEEARTALSAVVDASTEISLAVLPMIGVEALLEEAQTAAVLIVQRRSMSTLRRAFSATTSHTVAAQSACPVIVIKHDQFESESKRGIVVGIGPHSGNRALEIGVAEAAARKRPLTAVYVWDLQFSPTYGSRIEPGEEEIEEAARWADSRLAGAVAGVAKAHPELEFHARSVKGVIEGGLLRECENAELLVVERHRDAHRASIGLGTLTRHLIDQSPCPIMITPHSDAADRPDDLDVPEQPRTTAQS
jgi:nucleotide-binding universal stress UspA family protein